MPPPPGPLDELFRQPPAAHVEARDALAAKLRKAGDRASAELVKKLKRPSPPAWAINQLYFQKPELLDAAQRATAALASLHARDGVGPTELSAAVTTQRRAIQAAIDAAVRHAAEAGLPISSIDQRKIETTLKAWLSGAGDEPPGRMTHELEASGFAAVTAVGLTSSRPPSAAKPEPEPGKPATAGEPPAQATLPLLAAMPTQTGPDPARLSRVRANVRKREQEADAARKLADQVQTELAQQESALERARAELREAERALQALSTQLKQQEVALRTHRSHSTEASAAARDAERALAAARTELARLTDPK